MGSTPKTLKRKSEIVPGNEEEDNEKVVGKKSEMDEVKSSLTNTIVTDEWKGPSSPAGLPSLDGRKPAEVFRTDLISAMKLPDYHILSPDMYITISDPWRQEWERGVQVPVNPEGLHQPSFREIEVAYKKSPNFKLASQLVTSESRTRPKKKCPYNLNRMDVEWLTRFNRSRRNRGNLEVEENTLEKAIAYLENKCYDNMGHAITTQDGLSIEFDEDVCCDVCQSPDAEELNEMVFCDSCDICVHQACYGIRNIPPGSYLCHPCRKRAVSPSCLLCPHTGGAMKRAKNGKDWIHVSCALWIPEVGFGNVEKMEPITRTENIPVSRWNLVCVLCREKVGACIQCSVKSCVTAFHVTCGFKNGLEMKTILDDSSADGVRHISYCTKHGHKNKSPCRSPEKERQIKEEKETQRQKKLRQMEEEFYTFINVAEAAKDLNLPKEAMLHIHAYWALKRKAQFDVPLLPPTLQQQEKLSGKQVSADVRLQHQMEKFVRLRHDLERLRNLCYMVNRREKTRRELYRAQEQVFWKQVEILTDETRNISEDDVKWVIEAGKGNFTCNVSPELDSKEGHLWSSESSADDDSDSGSSAGKSNSVQKHHKGRSQEGCSSDDRISNEYTFQSAAESDGGKPANTAAGPFTIREGQRCSQAEETKALSVGEIRNDSSLYPATPNPSHMVKYSRNVSLRNNSKAYDSVTDEEIGKNFVPLRIPKHETLAPNVKVPDRSGDSSVELDTVVVPRPVRKTQKNNKESISSSPCKHTRKNAGNEVMVSLPYYAKRPRKKSTRGQLLKQEKEATLDQVQSPAKKPNKVSLESPSSRGTIDERALEFSIDNEQDRPLVETFRRRTRSSSEALHQGSVEAMAEMLCKTPERVLRNRKREDPNSDKQQSSNASNTPLGFRKRKLEPSMNSVDTLCFAESPQVNNSRTVSVTSPRVKTEHQTPEQERLSDEEFPKENEPMSPQSRSPKRMRITADNEIIQEALERGFDSKRLRSNTNFGTEETFVKNQSVVDNKMKKQSHITNFLHAKPGSKIKSPKELQKIRCRHRNNKATHSSSCSQTTSNLVKNGNHEHSSSTCPDCKIQRDHYRTMSPQGQHKHVERSPSHADRWNGIITRRDLGLRPLDSSPHSEAGYQNHQITVV